MSLPSSLINQPWSAKSHNTETHTRVACRDAVQRFERSRAAFLVARAVLDLDANRLEHHRSTASPSAPSSSVAVSEIQPPVLFVGLRFVANGADLVTGLVSPVRVFM